VLGQGLIVGWMYALPRRTEGEEESSGGGGDDGGLAGVETPKSGALLKTFDQEIYKNIPKLDRD
jgi:hypothetical protein